LIFYPLRFFCGRADGQRLFFMSAGSGLALGLLAFLLTSVVRSNLPESSSITRIGLWVDRAIPVPFAGSLLLSLLLGPLLGLAANFLCLLLKKFASSSADMPTAKWTYKKMLDRFGSPMAQLFRRAADEQKLVLLSLKSRKIYCGRLLEVPFNLDVDNAYIELLPKFSGHRDKDTLELGKKRIEYPAITLWEAIRYLAERNAVREEIESSLRSATLTPQQTDILRQALSKVEREISELRDAINAIQAPAHFTIDDWKKVIPVGEIESASFFDSDAFGSWFQADEGDKGGPDEG
ncbi:MAG: hypothetical protein ACREPT_15235, partial [Rudaea sp.]